MKANIPTSNESIYSLLVRSEEKERNLSETLVYTLLTLSTVFSLWQLAQQPFTVPVSSVGQGAPIAHRAAVAAHKA